MRASIFAGTFAACAIIAGTAAAEPYQDYTPEKGLWHVVTVKVDPNHVDDYLAGLKTGWVPIEEIQKKHGLIDAYQIRVKLNAADGEGNVELIEHIPGTALLDPDKARDQAVEQEIYAALPKAKSDEQIKGFDKYRVFVGDSYWQTMDFDK